jgi:hypothetical protein
VHTFRLRREMSLRPRGLPLFSARCSYYMLSGVASHFSLLWRRTSTKKNPARGRVEFLWSNRCLAQGGESETISIYMFSKVTV